MPRQLFQITVNVPANAQHNLANNDLLNPYLFVRNRLYHFVFNRFCLVYSKITTNFFRKSIEYFLLVAALFSFIFLLYCHIIFVRTPQTCLDQYKKTWENTDILRIELLSKKGREGYNLEHSYQTEKALRHYVWEDFVQSLPFYYDVSLKDDEDDNDTSDINDEVEDVEIKDEPPSLISYSPLESYNTTDDGDIGTEVLFQPVPNNEVSLIDPKDAYILEFSLDYGILKLKSSKRKAYNISVAFIPIDPDEDSCFGGSFNIYLLDNYLGYDQVFTSSLRHMTGGKAHIGFIHKPGYDAEPIILSDFSADRSMFLAAFIMLIFTVTVSTLLRHSHHQIFIIVGYWGSHVMNALERPSSNVFGMLFPPNVLGVSSAPILAVVLSLVGMENVMSDFFDDRSTALHVIIIVWLADLYDVVCCQSTVTKRNWYKFFCIYHLFFYIYNYKYAVFWQFSLLTSWLFTLHSMVYFFHNYELTRFMRRMANLDAARTGNNSPQQNAPRPDANSAQSSGNSNSDAASNPTPESDSTPPQQTAPSSPGQSNPPPTTPQENSNQRKLKNSMSLENLSQAEGSSPVRANSLGDLRKAAAEGTELNVDVDGVK